MKKFQILVLGDIDVDSLFLQERCFYDPVQVRRLSEGINLIKTKGFDLLLVDLDLPDSNGIKTFRELHRLCPATAILVITAADQEEMGVEALREGAQDYIVKGRSGRSTLAHSFRCAIERQHVLNSSLHRERERGENEKQLLESRNQLRRLVAARESAREAERARISRELHSDSEQLLTAIKMDLMWAKSRLVQPLSAEVKDSLEERLGEAQGLADRISGLIQKMAVDLRPSVLDNLGLAEALQDEARRFEQLTGIGVNFDPPESLPRLHNETVTVLFRIFQELLANINYHAHASLVDVFLSVVGPKLELRVHDNGIGIKGDQLTESTSMGLFWMNERALSLGGEIIFEGSPYFGTQAHIRVPCRLA